ncbi:MAG: YcgN family cysteine cluster protein [Pseudomonadota bacterium]
MQSTSSSANSRAVENRAAGFWEQKTLGEMTAAEWESLCDGCGRCCLLKVEDEDTGDIYLTGLACALLDLNSCRCRDYPNRQTKVPDCISLTPDAVAELGWLPPTCAYRRVAEGRGLAWWHPLVSGDPETVHTAGISVRGRALSETAYRVARIEDFIVSDWPEMTDEMTEETTGEAEQRE